MRLAAVTLASGLCATLAACGATAPQSPAAAVPASACQDTATTELAAIARRIYAQAVDGRNVVSAVDRLTHSPSLSAAVAANDSAAVRRALVPLLKHQVVRLDVFGTHRRLIAVGRTPAFAPVRAELHGRGGASIGHLLLAVTGDRAYVGITRRLTGAQIIFTRGSRRLVSSLPAGSGRLPARGSVRVDGTDYRAATIRAEAFPAGRLAITLLVRPLPASICGNTAADTRLRVIGVVGRRLFTAEQASPSVQRTLRYAAADPAFRRAAASEDPVALRAAIVGFFRNHDFHIVRVRLTKGRRAVYDLGGPYVLAPASHAILRPDGRPAGRFTLAVQDDTGYIKLMHRFTGAAVQLRTAAGPVPGSTLAPGPAAIPDHGTVTYAGRRYGADSFTAVAFPSGPLRVSLLVGGAD